jgi:DNA adenine methylase
MAPESGVIETPVRRQIQVRPFLKWAGGKRQLLPVLRKFYPRDFGRYLEPFLGSGAVFFDLYNCGALKNRHAVLIDNNVDLIGCYIAVRDHVEEVIRELGRLAKQHARGGSEFFYLVRDRHFNPGREEWVNAGPGRGRYPTLLAAMLIYLNRTGFNGLFRLNAAGRFNVPVGRYTNPQICDSENLRMVADALACGVELRHGSFDDVRHLAAPGDFLYFDPPYAPLSKTARFTSYTASQFGIEDQERLYALAIQLATKRCHVVISNSTAPEIEALYEGRDSVAAGLVAHRVEAKRAINSNPEARGNVSEFVLATVPRAAAVS